MKKPYKTLPGYAAIRRTTINRAPHRTLSSQELSAATAAIRTFTTIARRRPTGCAQPERNEVNVRRDRRLVSRHTGRSSHIHARNFAFFASRSTLRSLRYFFFFLLKKKILLSYLPIYRRKNRDDFRRYGKAYPGSRKPKSNLGRIF